MLGLSRFCWLAGAGKSAGKSKSESAAAAEREDRGKF